VSTTLRRRPTTRVRQLDGDAPATHIAVDLLRDDGSQSNCDHDVAWRPNMRMSDLTWVAMAELQDDWWCLSQESHLPDSPSLAASDPPKCPLYKPNTISAHHSEKHRFD